MRMLLTAFFCLLALGHGTKSLSSAGDCDWPRLGGPEGCNVSRETGLLRSWPAGGPRVLWSIELGQGFAGAAVRDGQVYVLDRVDDRQDILLCLDLETGHRLWQVAYDAPGTLPYNGSRNVPTVDANLVFALGPLGHFHCIDRCTHRIVWSRHLVNDFKDPQIDRQEPPRNRQEQLARAQVPTWGLTQAPLLYRDMVIVAPQTQKVGLVAYEKSSGELRWSSGYIGRNWYSHISPQLMRLCSVEQIVMLAQPSDPEKAPQNAPPAIVSGTDPATGQILWTTLTPAPHKIPVPQPLQVGHDRLLVTGGYGLGCAILRIRREGGRWQAETVLHTRSVAAHIHGPALYEDRVYLMSLREQGASCCGLVCLSTDAEPLWQTGPALQFENGAMLIADGMAFVLHGRTGYLHLIELLPGGYRLLGSCRVLEARDAQVWAPMALSQGRLILRDQHRMKCLDVRGP